MKSIALIHTVESVAVSFGKTLKKILNEEVKIHNIWDDFLANNPNEIGEFTIDNRNRLFNDIKSAEMTGADVIDMFYINSSCQNDKTFYKSTFDSNRRCNGRKGSSIWRKNIGTCNSGKYNYPN